MELPTTPDPCPQNVVTLSSGTLVVCPGCVKPFQPRRKDQRFCSSKCRLVGYQQKQEHARRDRDATARLHLRAAQHAGAEMQRHISEALELLQEPSPSI